MGQGRFASTGETMSELRLEFPLVKAHSTNRLWRVELPPRHGHVSLTDSRHLAQEVVKIYAVEIADAYTFEYDRFYRLEPRVRQGLRLNAQVG